MARSTREFDTSTSHSTPRRRAARSRSPRTQPPIRRAVSPRVVSRSIAAKTLTSAAAGQPVTVDRCCALQSIEGPNPASHPVSPAFYFSIFLDLLCVGTVVPFTTRHAAILHIRPTLVGAVQAVYGIMQMISTPVLGTLSDRHGARWFLLLSVAGTAASYAILSVALWRQSVWLFLMSRVMIGATRQTMCLGSAHVTLLCRSAATARTCHSVSDGQTEIQRDDADGGGREGTDGDAAQRRLVARGLALFQSAASAGFVAGPAVGGCLGDRFGVAASSLVAAMVGAVNFVLMWFVTAPNHRPLPAVSRPPAPCVPPSSRETHQPLTTLYYLLRRGGQGRWCLLSSMWYSLAYISFHTTLPLVAADVFGWSMSSVGVMISVASCCNSVALTAALPRILRFAKERGVGLQADSVVMIGCAAGAVAGYFVAAVSAVALVGGSSSSHSSCAAVGFMLGFFIAAVLSGMSDVLQRAKFSTAFPKERSGEILSLLYSVDGCNRVVAPLLGGVLLDWFGFAGPFTLIVAAGSAATAILVATSQHREQKKAA